MPPAPAAAAINVVSRNTWRIRRARDAPSAARTANSCSRRIADARNRLPTLAQAASSTSATAPCRSSSTERCGAASARRHSTIAVPKCVALVAGYSTRRRAMIASRSLRAWSIVTPGRSRPVTRRNPASREVAAGIGVDGKRRDDLGVADSRDERGRQDADDGVRVAVQDERLAHGRRAPAETPHPEAVGQDDDPGAAPLLVLRGERPAEGGARAEHREERRRGLHALDALGFAAGQVRAPLKGGGEVLEGTVAVAQIAVIRNRQRLGGRCRGRPAEP